MAAIYGGWKYDPSAPHSNPLTPPSASADNEQSSELERLIFEYGPDDLETRLRMIIAYARDGKNQPKDIYVQLILKAVAHHTKETVARAKAEARKAAFDKIFEMAPKGNFEHWTKQMTANWFVALGRLERELSAPQQSTSPDGDADNELQICECGDYRRDHENGTGACRMPDDLTHGFRPCTRFRPTTSPDKEQKEK